MAKLKEANVVILQMPLNWMSMPWTFKKYVDDVWSAGMMGELSAGDGRSAELPKKNYCMGGLLKGKYMPSITSNAPKEAFNDPISHEAQPNRKEVLFAPLLGGASRRTGLHHDQFESGRKRAF